MNIDKLPILTWSAIVITLCGLLLPTVSTAQQYHDPGLLQKTIDRKPVDYQAPGARVGSFVLKPGAEITFEDNDNVFYLNDNEISDSIVHIRPWANLASDWNRHELNIDAYADFAWYNDIESQDYEDLVLRLDGRIDVKRGSYFSYKASYMDLHEDRSSPDGSLGRKPTEFNHSGLGVSYSHTFNRMKASLGYQTVDTDYDNNVDSSGNVVDHQDRDRTRDALTLRLDYELSPGRGVFFSAASNEVDYDQQFDNGGFQRSSDGTDIRIGLTWDITGVITGEFYGQYLDQDYDDPTFNSIDGFGLGASLDWTPTLLTNVHVRFANSPQETTQSQTSGYFSSLYSIRIQQELKRNLLANLRYSYTDNEYEFSGSGTASLNDTQVTRASFGLSYLFNRNAYLSGGYTIEKQDADTFEFDYETNRWFITLGLDF